MRRKNKKREKLFAVNYKIDPNLLNSLDQIAIVTDSIITPFKISLADKGYKTINKPVIRPYSDIVKDADKDLYQISVKAIYVGKRKAKEAL